MMKNKGEFLQLFRKNKRAGFYAAMREPKKLHSCARVASGAQQYPQARARACFEDYAQARTHARAIPAFYPLNRIATRYRIAGII